MNVQIMICRDPASCVSTRQSILDSLQDKARDQAVGEITLATVDLANFTSVRECAKQISSQYNQVDVLLNNAGTISQTVSGDG